MIYFLKPSYWSRHRKRYVEVSSVYEAEVNGTPSADESVEPVSPEFRGKEAIRYQATFLKHSHYLVWKGNTQERSVYTLVFHFTLSHASNKEI